MRDYRLYCLNGLGKIIAEAEWVSAVDDKEAVILARAMRKPGDCELWEGNRRVAMIAYAMITASAHTTPECGVLNGWAVKSVPEALAPRQGSP